MKRDRTKLLVLKKRCPECLFSGARLVPPSRMEEILRLCERKNCHFTCHRASIAGFDAVCRGFYEERTTPALVLGGLLGRLEFIDVPGKAP